MGLEQTSVEIIASVVVEDINESCNFINGQKIINDNVNCQLIPSDTGQEGTCVIIRL